MSQVSVCGLGPATSATTIGAALKQGVAQARTTLDCADVAACFRLSNWQRAMNAVRNRVQIDGPLPISIWRRISSSPKLIMGQSEAEELRTSSRPGTGITRKSVEPIHLRILPRAPILRRMSI
jgi:hypothetical protein